MGIAFFIFALAPVAQNQQLLGADEVLKKLSAQAAEIAANRKSFEPTGQMPVAYIKQLDHTKRLKEFYAAIPTLEPNEAGIQWLKLLDESLTLGTDIDSLVSVLPPPQSWPVVSEGLEKRMAKRTTVRGAAFRLFGTLLGDDHQSQEDALRNSWAFASSSTFGGGSPPLEHLYALGATLALQNGNTSLMKESLLGVAQFQNRLYIEDSMLDALGPDKEAFLAELLAKAKCSLTYSSYYSESPNGKLLYKVALQTAPTHQAPHWGLAERMDNTELYEAIAKRFDPFKNWPPTAAKERPESSMGYGQDRNGRLARTFYLLSLAKAGNLDKAIKGAGDGTTLLDDYSISYSSIHPDPKVIEFLRRVLTAHPASSYWKTYEDGALSLGHYQELLDATDTALKQTGLSDKYREPILHARESALLALDRVDEAVATMRKRVAINVKDSGSFSSEEAVYRLESLAKLLDQKALNQEVAGLLKSGKYANNSYGSSRKDLKQREAELVQSDPRFSYRWGGSVGVELISIYSAANRPADVIKVAEAEGLWTEGDIREVEVQRGVYETGGASVPTSVALGMALNKVGRHDEAYRIAKDYVSRNLGDDTAYEFLLSCGSKDVLTDLDAFAKLNAYEERPLIWKAKVLLDQGKTDEAEQAIKAAIAIDPSDGEQPHGRRMYAYTVYADILEKKGDATQAEVFRGAVRAIRIAEKADDYLKVGMVKRAIKMYDEALSEFSDAYCIQSRLAINLAQSGRMPEAIAHYRRAYELMADSFGYVETHCFGCEDAFTGETQQKIAEEVFTRIAIERPTKPQIHYLFGFLRETQGRGQEAVEHYKRAVELDGRYLNAWKRLSVVGKKYLPAEEVKGIDAKIAEIEPRVESSPDYSRFEATQKLTFAAAYRKAQEKLAATGTPLFKLKKKPTLPEDPLYGSDFGRGNMMDEPRTPGEALMQTSLYSQLNNLLRQRY